MMVCDFLLSQQTFDLPAVAADNPCAEQALLGGIALRIWTRATAPLVERVQQSGWSYWLFGELFGQHRSLAQALTATGTITAIDSPPLDVATLNGSFLLLARSDQTGDWHVWTDRFGTLHAYWGNRGGQPVVGTRFIDLAAGSSNPLDWQGIVGFLGFGFFPGDRTYREGVRIMRPASHYVFDAELQFRSVDRYWNWTHTPNQRRTYDETVGAFAECFDQAVIERLERGRVAVPISGGLDSRSTVTVVGDQAWRSNLWCYTYGYSDDSVESAIGRQVAACRRLPCESLTIGPYLFENSSDVLSGVEGFQDVTQSRQAAVTREIAANAEFVMAAHWGDVWLDDMGVAEKLTAPNDAELAQYAHGKIKKRGSDWLLEHVGTKSLPVAERSDLLRQFVRDELTRIPNFEDADFRVKAFKTEQWSFRWTTASLRAYHAGAFPRLPFYDHRIADFFSTVPTQSVANRRLQIDYLKRCAPDLAGVTWQEHGRNLFDYERPDRFSVVKRAWNKAASVATRRPMTQRNWEVQFGGAAGRAGIAHWLQRRGLRLHEHVDPSHIDKLITTFYARRPDGPIGYTVSMLVTFSMWLETYG
jgi:asparagine synthase (glutamine-hydrolysing)